MCLHPCPKRQDNFNPRAPCGARLFLSASVTLPFNFNPRAPHGARPKHINKMFGTDIISIRAPRAGRDQNALRSIVTQNGISIRAPRAGRDEVPREDREPTLAYFNPRAPCGARHLGKFAFCTGGHFNPRAPCGARRCSPLGRQWPCAFQSARPVRGATRRRRATRATPCNFNPRAPCGARRRWRASPFWSRGISIRAPRAGRDRDELDIVYKNDLISIRAPRAGRDEGEGSSG